MRFEVLAKDGAARRGRLHTAHGIIDTPAFMPVGTAATVKGMLPDAVAGTGAQIVLGNTYHLMLRPGAERIADLGGLRRFMGWDGPVLTDSGGYQVMSLSDLRTIDDQGVRFRSHIDGSPHHLSPERAVEIQHLLGSTITMVLDECIAHPATPDATRRAMDRSLAWAERSRAAFVPRPGHGLFAIVQGGMDPMLREECALALAAGEYDGLAVGGLAVGEPQELMFEMLEATVPHLPEEKPHYLMGVGRPDDIIGAVRRGIDMFDCVMPTRSGRTAQAFTRSGVLNLRNARHRDDPAPLDPACACPACARFSRAYLHHLFRADEMLGPILLTWHNLRHYQDLMLALREAIAGGDLANFAWGAAAPAEPDD